jgi:alpha-ribazole phosphatase/probable phosphoglycerate mutase
MTTRLVLVRHAEPEDEARGRCYGTLDVGLSPQGAEHALRLAEALASLRYEVVYTSPRVRSVETARPLAAARGLTPVVEPDLREIDFGRLEGRTYEEIERSEPELFRAWMETPTRVRFPEGESYDDLRVRAERVLDEIRARQSCAVVVTHGGVVRAGLAAWLRMPGEAIFRLDQRYCGVTIVDWLDGTPIVRLLNGAWA